MNTQTPRNHSSRRLRRVILALAATGVVGAAVASSVSAGDIEPADAKWADIELK